MFLSHCSVSLVVLITFRLILARFGKIKKSKMVSICGYSWHCYHVIWRHHFPLWTSKETSLDILSFLQESLSALILRKLRKGPRIQKTEKKPVSRFNVMIYQGSIAQGQNCDRVKPPLCQRKECEISLRVVFCLRRSFEHAVCNFVA